LKKVILAFLILSSAAIADRTIYLAIPWAESMPAPHFFGTRCSFFNDSNIDQTLTIQAIQKGPATVNVVDTVTTLMDLQGSTSLVFTLAESEKYNFVLGTITGDNTAVPKLLIATASSASDQGSVLGSCRFSFYNRTGLEHQTEVALPFNGGKPF